MKRFSLFVWPPVLALTGIVLVALVLAIQTRLFRSSVEELANDVRVSLIDLSGKVVYDTAGGDLPNHAGRAEFEEVKRDGRPRTVVRESETLHKAMFYHARRVGDYVVRIAVPYRAVVIAQRIARIGMIGASLIGASLVAVIFIIMRKTEKRLLGIAAERDAKEALLVEMRKLEAFRRDFVSNVTHEIKTPLTGILGAVEALEDSDELSVDERHEMLKVVKDQSVRLNALAQDILSLAKLERAEAEPHRDFIEVDLADVVRNVFTVMKPKAARAGVGLVLLKAESARISCDAVLIEEAVTNLVENALRYSRSKTIELSLVRENGRSKISVVDHGIGIAEEHLPRLFERFYRVDKARSRQLGGTGLGLAIVKHIVQLHGGEASVVSNLGKGSEFSLAF